MSSVLLYRFSRRFVIPYIRGWTSPNQITALRLITGIVSCGLIASDPNRWAVIAGILWLLSTYLDRLDGELARVCGTTSDWGRFYDYISDLVCVSGFFIAAGIGLSFPYALALSTLAGVSVGTAIILSEVIENRDPTMTKTWTGIGIFDLDDSVFLFSIFLWLDMLEFLVIGGAIGGTFFAIATAIQWLKKT